MESGEPPPATHIPGRCCHQRTRPTPPPAPRARPPLGSELRLWSQSRVQGGPTLHGRDPALSDLSFSTRVMGPARVSTRHFQKDLSSVRTAEFRVTPGLPPPLFLCAVAPPPRCTQGHSRPLSPPPSSVAHGAPWAARPGRGHQGGDECTAHLLQGSARLTLGAPLLLEAHPGGLSALATGRGIAGPGLPAAAWARPPDAFPSVTVYRAPATC